LARIVNRAFCHDAGLRESTGFDAGSGNASPMPAIGIGGAWVVRCVMLH